MEWNEIREADLGKSFQKARKVCGVIRCVFVVAAVLYAFSCVLSVVIILSTNSGKGLFAAIVPSVYTVLYGGIVIAFLVIMVRIFAEVGRGFAPFSEKQANRLRLIAILVLALALLEFAFTASVSYSLIPEVGYSIGINDAYPTDSINLNVGMLAFSAIMYSLSALFRYAALLQQLSDDTV